MKDRNVQYASRFRLTKVQGTDDVYDLIPAPGEVYEEGTLINKSSLLKDDTAALFGLDANAVPDDALNVLARFFFDYWWRRRTIQQQTMVSSTLDSFTLLSATDTSTSTTIYFSSEIEVTPSNKINLINPIERTFTYYSNFPTAQELQGKYLAPGTDIVNLNNVLYIKNASRVAQEQSSGYYNFNVYGTIEDLQPNIQKGEWSSVNSTERNAYPDSGVSDGYEYAFIGKPSDYSYPPTRMQFVTYTGTGTYGASNPNILTFNFVPMALYLLYWYNGDPLLGKNFYNESDSKICAVYPMELSTSYTYQRGFLMNTSSNATYAKKSSDGKSIYWYNNDSASYQCNRSNIRYTVLAIG